MGFSFGGLFPGDVGITFTVNSMIHAVNFALSTEPAIRDRAERLVEGCPERAEMCEVGKIFAFVMSHFRYLPDPRPFELLKSPEVVDSEINTRGTFQGDCDDATMYLCALLSSIGYGMKICVINVNGMGDDYRHVYPKVFIKATRTWVTLEATARNYPMGWEPPNGGRYREFLF